MDNEKDSPDSQPKPMPELSMRVPPGTKGWDPDLVVIDRRALNQMLDAVLNILEATKGMEMLNEAPELNRDQIEQASFDLAKVREALSLGIRQMKDSVSGLPTVSIKEEE